MAVRLGDMLGPVHATMTPEEARTAALAYVDLGWAVIPGPGLDEAGACSCHRGMACGKNAGKHAYAGWGNDTRRTATRGEAEALWSDSNDAWEERPVDQVFIVPYLSGLVAADVDNMDAWLRLPESDRPATLFQRSGSGRGGHFLYRFAWDTSQNEPPRLGGRLPNGAGEIKFRGIIGAAPNVHPSGGRYAWENWGHPLAEAPEWITQERTRDPWDGVVDPSMLTGFWGDALWEVDMADVARLGDLRSGGGRPVVLFAVASKLTRWIRAGRMTEQDIVDLLMEMAGHNGAVADYGPDDIERQIRNGVKAGLSAKETEA